MGNKYLSKDDWLNKLGYMHIMQYSIAIKQC